VADGAAPAGRGPLQLTLAVLLASVCISPFFVVRLQPTSAGASMAAWLAVPRPSQDPTPVDPLALRLALVQPTGNAAYLARPCQ